MQKGSSVAKASHSLDSENTPGSHPRLGLTSLQQELWLSHRTLPDDHPGISCGGLFELDDRPDPDLLREALGVLVRHFPLLSATLREESGPFPVIETRVWNEPDFTFVDLADRPDPVAAAHDWIADFVERPFVPLGGALCRFALIATGPHSASFVNRFFHVAADGIVCIAHYNVLTSIYNDLREGRPVALGPVQDWADDLEQDRRHLASERGRKDRDFWRERLPALPTEPLFTPRPGCPDRIETISRLEYDLSADFSRRLDACAARHGSSPSSVLLGLHLTALSRLYDAERLVLHLPLRFGEQRDQWCFHGHRVSLCPLGVEIGPGLSFAGLLDAIRKGMLALLRRARTPYQSVLREGGGHLDLARTWDANFNFISMPADGRFGAAKVRVGIPLTSRFDPVLFGIYVIQVIGDAGLHLSIDYSDNHFGREDVLRYLERLDLVLDQVLADPDRPLAEGGVLLEAERSAIEDWQTGARRDYLRGTIPALFERSAALRGPAAAVRAEGGDISYQELSTRSDRIAAWLLDAGVRPSEVVAVLARRDAALPETILGIMKAGAVYLPVDPDYPAERVDLMLRDSGARKILALDDEDLGRFAERLGLERPPAELPPAPPLPEIGEDDPAYLIYTSGSTGTPKGVLLAHRGFVNMIQAQIEDFGIRAEDRVLQFASPSFDASLSEIFMALLAGACLCPVPRALIDEPWRLRERMRALGIGVATFPPAYLRLFGREPLGLRVLITAGEPPVPEDARHYAAELRYFNAYGPTEASVCAAMTRIDPESAERSIHHIGRPIANSMACILDTRGRQVAPGIPGELCLAGPGLALGYLNRPDLTAERFVEAGFAPGLRLYRTGDRALWDTEGGIVLMGRLDEQVKIRGHRIEPGEVGAVLEGHPDVARAAALALPVQDRGLDLIAFFVPREPNRIDEEALRAWLAQRLPAYMLPSRLIPLDALPLAPTGKVDRQALAGLVRRMSEESGDGTETADGLETEVLEVVREVLGIRVSSLETDFFALGGDSIRLIDLGRALAARFGRDLSTRRLLADSSVRGIASALRDTHETAPDARETDEPLPLSRGQFQLWTLDQIQGPSARYNMPFALEIECDSLDEERLIAALVAAVDAQPACRQAIEGDIDRPRWRPLPTSGLRPSREDLSAEADPEAVCDRLFQEQIHRPFDLTRAPLLRAMLVRLDRRRARLLLVVHHIVGDGLSLHLILADLFRALDGHAPMVRPRRQLADWVASESAYLEGPEAEEDLNWWRGRLDPLPPRLDLFRGPRPALKSAEGDLIRLPLAPEVRDGLESLADRAGVTRLACFLSLVLRFLAHETEARDPAVALPAGLREGSGLQDLAGYFVNTLVLRASDSLIGTDEAATAALEASRILREAVGHGRYPFPMLAERLGGERDPSRSPLVDVLVTEIDESALFEGLVPPPGMRVRPIDSVLRASKLDTSFILHRRPDASALVLEYDTRLAGREEAEDLLNRFHAFCAAELAGRAAPAEGVAPNRIAEQLEAVWRQVLGVETADAESNFFSCGGDSIKAIQIVGQLRRLGLSGIVPGDLFTHPTLGQIRSRLAEAEPSTSRHPAARPDGAVRLLPMQERLLRRHPEHWRRFHMVLPLAVSSGYESARLRRGVEELPARHPILGLVFSADGTARLPEEGAAGIWEEIEASADLPDQRLVAEAAERLFARLDPESGRLVGAVLVHRGERRLLLLGGHHLVLDVVSLDLLRRELQWFCEHSDWPDPGEDFPGALAWAQRLDAARTEDRWQFEAKRWLEICRTATAPLPGLRPNATDRAGDRVPLIRRLTAELPTERPRVRLLAGLARALHALGTRGPVMVELESHGREPAFPDLDVGDTPGWLTLCAPLQLMPSDRIEEAVLERWFSELSHNGLGFSILARAEPERFDYRPQIAFNYLGSLTASDGEGLSPLPDLALPGAIPGLMHPDFCPDAPLDLMAYVSGGELVLLAYFSPARLDAGHIEALLDAWVDALAARPEPTPERLDLAARADCRPEEIETILAPTPAQASMLFQRELDGAGSGIYAQQIGFRLLGRLDPTRLAQAWGLVVDRHAALRGLFPEDRDGEPRWLILRRGRTLFEYQDLTALPASQRDLRLQETIDSALRRGFDLDRGPLILCTLLRLDEEEQELCWTFHHILMDGWCIAILLRELFAAHAALVSGETPDLPPPPPLQRYLDWRQGRDRSGALSYWRSQLAGLKTHTFIAPNAPGNEHESPEPGHREVEWRCDPERTRVMGACAARMQVSQAVLIQSLWTLLLASEHSDAETLVFGLVSAGRPAEVEGMASMIGLFLQTLPVVVRPDPDEPLAELAGRLQRQALERAPHEFLPLAEIQTLAPIGAPLFDHILVFENYPADGLDLPDAPRIAEVRGVERHPYDLGLSVIPGAELRFRLTWSTARLGERRPLRLLERWRRLVEGLTGDANPLCRDLIDLATPGPETAIPTAFNDTTRPYPRNETIDRLFLEMASRRPEAPAMLGSDGAIWTYADLERLSGAVAGALGPLAPGEPVALAMERGPLAVPVMLGILRAGGCYLPIDLKNPPARISGMLDAAACRILVHDATGLAALPADAGPRFLPVETLLAARAGDTAPAMEGSNRTALDPACIMFTSGSTGAPKGVLVPHRAVVRLVRNNGFLDIGPDERFLQAGPLGFDASTLEIWGPLLNGAALGFISDEDLLTPGGLCRTIAERGIGLMWLTSSLCNLLVDEDPATFQGLRVLLTGGEALSPAHMARLMDACPDLAVLNGYGPTENATFTTTHRIGRSDLDSGRIPIGRPVGNTRVHVVRPDGRPAELGEWGELCAAGDGLALGYVGRADLTAAQFVELPPPIAERVYRTGDIVRWRPDGRLEFQGRRDSQVKVRGYRIELAEIESALNALPGVLQSAVLADGEGEDRRLLACVRVEEGRNGNLAAELAERLPSYMIPERIQILGALPLTASGKLDRTTLLAMASGPDPRPAAGPSAALEDRVAALFAEVLETEVPSPEADFFDLGGHSLKAMRLLARLRTGLGVEISLRDVLAHTSVRALAGRLRTLQDGGAPAPDAIPALGELGDYPLSSGQERLWFLQHLQPESSVYNVPFAARIDAGIDAPLLRRALRLVEERQDALRLRVPAGSDGQAPRQTLAPPGRLALVEEDLSGVPDPAGRLAERVDEEVVRPFRFGPDAPLIRAFLFREGADGGLLLLICHHLICDGWSGEVFLRDLGLACAALRADTPVRWPTLPVRYVDYAAWQRGFLEGPEGRALAERWRTRLTPLPEPLALPLDRPRPAVRGFAGGVRRVRLGADRTQALREIARRHATTLFAVLASAVGVFLHRHTGQTEILVGVPVAGRQRSEIEDLVGFFVNTLPLRCRLDPEASVSQLLGALSGEWQACLADQLYPLEALIEDLQVRREASRNPLFDVLVALEDEDWTTSSAGGVLDLRPYPIRQRFSKMDLSLYFRPRDGGLEIDLEYSRELFLPETAERLAARLLHLLQTLPETCRQPIHRLAIMPGDELERVVEGFNATDLDWDLDGDIDARFRARAGLDPEATAIRSAAGIEIRYGQLDREVERLAGALTGSGVGHGDHVGVSFPRSPDLMRVIFAVQRIGAVYVPVVPGLPRERIRAMVEDLGRVTIVADEDAASALREAGARVLTLTDLERIPAAPLPPRPAPGDPAYVLFTSGSTGRPKGVVIEHRSVLNRIQWMQSRFPLGPGDLILQKTPVSFDVSVWELFWWSWTGAALAQLEPGGEMDPPAMVAAVSGNRATVMHFVPSMLRAFLDHLERSPDAVPRLASLRWVFASGEALTPDLVERFNRLLHRTNGTELHNLYGPTEATVDVSWQPCSPFEEGSGIPIGRPIANTRLYVLDPFGQPCPIGVAGELHIGGVQVARGYLNRPDLTAGVFGEDPFRPGSRFYRTGDLARWRPDGAVEYLGRTDHQVKVRGFRIELGEVEAACERIPEVAQAVVRVSELAGLPALEAFLLPRNGAQLTRGQIRRELERFLPDYMIPSLFRVAAEIPVNASGKADRAALAGDLLRDGPARQAVERPPQEAPSETAAEILDLWRQVLPAGAEVGPDENFFEAGGNSILLLRLHGLLEARWPGAFALTDLFAAVTATDQAARLTEAAPRPASAAVPAPGDREPIAVIGLALRLADFDDPDGLWADLLAGADRTGPLPEQRRSDTGAMLESVGIRMREDRLREAAYLDDIAGFDYRRFGLAPMDASLLDPEQRLFLETAFRCLEDGGYGGSALDGARVGVFAGGSPSQTFKEAASRSYPERAEQVYVINVPSSMPSRLGYLRNWNGPAELVDTACSSSLKAVWDACLALRRGDCDLAVAGGARVLLTPLRSGEAFTIETGSGRTLSFDAEADGVGAGEGAVVLLLKPLAQALEDGDAIRALIRGGAVNQDGRSASMAAPNPAAQAEVVRGAADGCGVSLDSLDFVEAHGTGTALGDPIEIDGLTRAFARQGDAGPKAAIGSVKGNYGHLDAAAGAIGLAKAILSLQHGVVPRQPHFRRPNPRIDFDKAPVFVARENHPLDPGRRPWRGGVSAFGLSGINVHLVLEQAPSTPSSKDDGSWILVPLSAASERGLRLYARQMLSHLAARDDWSANDLSATLTLGREHLPWRLAVLARDRREILEALLGWTLTPDDGTASTTPGKTQIQVAGLGNPDDAETARAAFLRGALPAWPEDRGFRRLNLPAVPMERSRCWPVFSADRTGPAETDGTLLGAGVESPDGRLFQVPVGEDAFWPVAEHRIQDRPALVGMAMPALLGEALADTDAGGLLIGDLSWLRPLFRDEVEEVCLRLRPDGRAWQASLSARDATGAWNDHAEARVERLGRTQERLDLDGLRKTLVEIPAREWDPETAATVAVGKRWNCRRRIWRGDAGTLALLELDPDYAEDLSLTPWHPAMLDVAASLALDGLGLVPAGCRSIRLLHPLERRCYAWATPRGDRAEDAPLLVDCRICDERGRLLTDLGGLLFLPLSRPAARLHEPVWNPLPEAEGREGTGAVLILGDADETAGLTDRFAGQGRGWIRRSFPRREEEAAELVQVVEREPYSLICGFLPRDGFDPWPLACFFKRLLEKGLGRPMRFVALGRGACPSPGTPAAETPDAALALGLLLSVAREEPLLSTRYIEIGGEPDPERLAAILEGPLPADDTPLRLDAEGGCQLRGLGPALADREPQEIATGEGVVLYSGGLGAMALTLARTLPGPGGKVALLHRGEVPDATQWPALAEDPSHPFAWRAARLLELRAAGIALRLHRCDVTDRDALAATLDAVRRDQGEILGVVHTAGVAGDGFLSGKSRETFEAVLAPKVDGVRHLHELTLSDPIRHFVLASSRTGLRGAPGQTDYAAANAYLDAFALWRHAQGLPALSLDWNAWDEIGMAARHGALAPGIPALKPDQAGPLLLRALASGAPQLVVTLPGERLDEPETERQETRDGETPGAEAQVRDIWAAVLGYTDPLSPEDDFYGLGGDSISGLQIVNRVNRELGLTLSLADLFGRSRLGDFLALVLEASGTEAQETGSWEPAPELEEYPVSWEQLAVLQAEAPAEPHTGYNLPQFLRLAPGVEPRDLEAALRTLIARHEILRTAFVGLDSPRPRMRILAELPFALAVRRVAQLDGPTCQSLVRPFDLGRAPLFRTQILEDDAGQRLFFLDIHHALADARTIDILLTELIALLRGEALPEPGPQQKDAAWQQHLGGEAADQAARDYWLGRFSLPLPQLDLPSDRPRPARHGNRGATHAFPVPAEWIDPLRALARSRSTTSHSLMLSLWVLLLADLADEEELVVAVAADGRDREELASCTGMFVSLLPLRLRPAGSASLADFLDRNHRLHAEALRHRAFALNRLLSELRAPARRDRTPLAEVTFSYMNFDSAMAPDADPPLEQIEVANPGCKADLAIFASDTGERLSFALEYYADLFDAERMERMGRRFLDLLAAVIELGPDRPLADYLPAGAELERRRTPDDPRTLPPDRTPAETQEQVDTELQGLVLGVFRDLFQQPDLTPDDSFFDLGGHSLLGLQIVNRLTGLCRRRLSIRDLFDHPTPADLSARLRTAPRTADPIVQDPGAGPWPLSHDQQRLYVLHQMDGGALAYNMPFAFAVSGPFEVERFRRALNGVIERHQVLRTAFVEEDGMLRQAVRDDWRPPIAMDEAQVDRTGALARFRADMATPFDLSVPPPLRIRICRIGPEEHLLGLVMHHICGDGWSMQILFGELLSLYSAAEDRPEGLRPLAVQYRDYALWQQERDWSAEAAYWRERLSGVPARIRLPLDKAPPREPRRPSAAELLELDAVLMTRLRDLAAARGVSLATLFLALFAALLHRLTGQADLLIGVGVAGREREELEDLVGFFVNILPIRLRMDAETEFEALLAETHKAMLEALERQDYPFDLLVRELSPDRGGGRGELVNVMFEYQRYFDLDRINRIGETGGLRIEPLDLDGTADASPGPRARYDLTLFVQDDPHGCRLRAEYDAELLTDRTVRAWLGHLEQFMRMLAAQDGTP
ncbi:non-ribosomal peptide synthetase [Imhoffiella purpurea]|uniref:Long-chain-fatty-acid--CoA ligase n=1 Tax=Imhoffiella purpurea TaxID=1249627 RepID=W9VBV5_9GAMM|nr:non-ribosomal peptide synthetase [Imhoffiella purpurea]EXJ13522.1 Long-chain-fatty-acid--CoA ligase [Imhoffiella purpurea]